MPAAKKHPSCRGRLAWLVVPLLVLAGLSHAQPARTVTEPSFKVGDTWEYRNYQVRTGKLNRTWVELVVGTQQSSARIRRTDSTGELPSERDVKSTEMYSWP